MVRNGKSTADISAISALTAVKHGSYSSLTPPLSPVHTRKLLIMAMNGVPDVASARIMGSAWKTESMVTPCFCNTDFDDKLVFESYPASEWDFLYSAPR